ncbi:MAG: MaoC family dehydratase [Pseudomonadota bacterium]
MDEKRLTFEDFAVGATMSFGDHVVTEDDAFAFATQFDPQAIHLDKDAANAGPLDGLSISGWHTCSILMRMMCDSFLLRSTSLGSPGIETLSWKVPVRPGDRLHARWTCVSARTSEKRTDLGICVFDYEVFNDNDDVVLTARVTHFFGREGAPS